MTNKPLHIGKNCKIGKNVKFGMNVIICDNVSIGDGSIISHNCIIGDSDIKGYKNSYESKETSIGKNSFIRPFTLISQDVKIGDNFQCGDKVLIRSGTTIGDGCSIGTMCDLQGNLSIGNFVRFHSNVHVGMLTEIEDFVWIYPYVVITNDPCPPMGKLIGTKIKKFSQICTMTTLLPGITIGENSLIGANSLVKDDVGEKEFVAGSPARKISLVTDLRDSNNNQFLPWKDFLKENRGYPWQNTN